MKILVTIPHFFGPSFFGPDGDEYGSTKGNVEKRVSALRSAILSFFRIFGYNQNFYDIGKNSIYPANQRVFSDVSIFICTSKSFHLLDYLNDEKSKFNNVSTDIDPKYLG